jgi:hypothetical protein
MNIHFLLHSNGTQVTSHSETIAVFTEIHKKCINVMCEKYVKIFYVKPDGT